MKQCRICKSTNDVRGDGICMGCYDARCATSMGMSYGPYIARYGHNYGRLAGKREKRRDGRVCALCGMPIDHMRKGTKFCGIACARRANWYRNHPDGAANRSSCRGCRWYISGSKRCTNPDSSMHGTDLNKCCSLYQRFEVDDGKNS